MRGFVGLIVWIGVLRYCSFWLKYIKKKKKKNYRPLALPQKNLQKKLYLGPSLSNFLDPSLLIGINFFNRYLLITVNIDNR
jgi:hypothetical protein